MTDAQIDAVWNDLLECDMETRYWATMYRRYKKLNNISSIIITVAGSGTFGAIVAPVLWGRVLCAGIAAIGGTVYKQLDHKTLLHDISTHRSKWVDLESQYELLWQSIPTMTDAEVLKKYAKLKADMVKIGKENTSLPHDDERLKRASYKRVCQSRGIESQLQDDDGLPQTSLASSVGQSQSAIEAPVPAAQIVPALQPAKYNTEQKENIIYVGQEHET